MNSEERTNLLKRLEDKREMLEKLIDTYYYNMLNDMREGKKLACIDAAWILFALSAFAFGVFVSPNVIAFFKG